MNPPSAASFYVTGGTLRPDAECYVERAADAALLRAIRAGEYCYVLNARQMGKSSLCVRTVARLNEEGIHTAFIDLTKFGVTNLTAEQWYAALQKEAGRELNLRTEFAASWRESAALPPVQRFFGALQEIALQKLSGRLVIFVDEIDVTRSIPFESDEFFAAIRQCYVGRASDPELDRLTFCLFGTATPAELIDDTKVSPFNIGQRVELKDFTRAEAVSLSGHLGANAKPLLDRIFYWTNGHPYLTQRLCLEVATNGATSPREVDALSDALFLSHKARESDDNLAFVRNRLLKNEVDVPALLELYAQLRAGRRVPDDETNLLCGLLKMSGVCRIESGTLRVRNRIYKRVFDRAWIETHMPDAELRRQKAAYRRGALRAALVGSVLVLALGSLAGAAIVQARRSQRLASSLRASEGDLRVALRKEQAALGRATAEDQTAKDAGARESAAANLARIERKDAVSAAAEAKRQALAAQLATRGEKVQAQLARVATSISNERLSHSLVQRAMANLEKGDGAAALPDLVTALKIDQGDPHRALMHRIRIEEAINLATALRQIWTGKGPMIWASFTSDGRQVVTANADGTARAWDASNGRPAGPPMVASGTLASAALSPDGRRLVLGALDGRLTLWSVPRARKLAEIREPGSVSTLDFSDDGRRLADGFTDSLATARFSVRSGLNGELRAQGEDFPGAIWQQIKLSPDPDVVACSFANNISTIYRLKERTERTLTRNFNNNGVAFARGGKWVLLAGTFGSVAKEGTAQLCSVETGQPIVRYGLTSTDWPVGGTSLRVSQDERLTLVSSSDGTAGVYDLRTGAPYGVQIRTGVSITDADLSPDDTLVATGSTDGTIRVWDVGSGEPVGSSLHHAGGILRVRFSPSGRQLLSTSADGTARLWQLGLSSVRSERLSDPFLAFAGNIDCEENWSRRFVRFRAKEYSFLVPGGAKHAIQAPLHPDNGVGLTFRRGRLQLYDFVQGKPVGGPIDGHDLTGVEDWKLSRDRSYLLVRSLDHIAYVFRLGRVPARVLRARFGPSPAPCSFGKETLALGVGNGEIRVYSLGSGRLISQVEGSDEAGEPNGRLVAMRYLQGRVRVGIYDHDSYRELGHLEFPGDRHLSFLVSDPSGRYVLAGTCLTPIFRGYAVLIDTSSGQPVTGFRPKAMADSFPGAFVVDPSDTRFFFCGDPAGIYDLKSGRRLLAIGTARVASATWSRDGRYLLTVDSTGAGQVWDARAGRAAGPPMPIGTTAGFSSEGDLVQEYRLGQVRLWDPRSGEQVMTGVPVAASAFDVVGRRLITMQPADTARGAWYLTGINLKGDPRPLEQLEALSRAVSGRSIADSKAVLAAARPQGLQELYAYRSPYFVGTRTVNDVDRDTRLDLDDGEGWIQLAHSAARVDRWQLADEAVTQAIREGIDDLPAWNLKARAASRLGRHGEACLALLRALKWDPRGAILNFEALKEALLANDFATACSVSDKLMKADWPGTYEYTRLLADKLRILSYVLGGSRRQVASGAVPDYGFMASFPDPAPIATTSLLVPDAITDWQPWLKAIEVHDPGHTSMELLRALALVHTGNTADARRALEGAQSQPELIPGLRAYAEGLLELSQKRTTQAEDALARAIRESTAVSADVGEDRVKLFYYASAMVLKREAAELRSQLRGAQVNQPSFISVGHVLFIDIVEFSKLSTSAQGRAIQRLTESVSRTKAHSTAQAGRELQSLPTGDGIALVFFSDVVAPARCALELAEAIGSEFATRMGIHSGIVQRQVDISGRDNLVGEGLNTAQRVMSIAEPGQILLSAQYARWLGESDEWCQRITSSGEATAKHGQQLSLYILHPDSTVESGPGRLPVVDPSLAKAIVVLYRRNAQPDEDVLHTVETRLTEIGHRVFVDRSPKVGLAWVSTLDDHIRTSDAVVAIVSPRSLQSEMLEFELSSAHDANSQKGKPQILPVWIGAAEIPQGPVASIVAPLHGFRWNGPQDDNRLVAELDSALREPLKPKPSELRLEPAGGAVPPDSAFYVRRPADREFLNALDARESILLVKGPRQIGKTSLIAQGATHVSALGARFASTDFQKLASTQLTDGERFCRLLAGTLARQLRLKYDFESNWDPLYGANLNFEEFLRAGLDAEESPIVWFMDEVDKLFTASFASDFFGLVRSWHNARSTDIRGPWGKLTVVIAYATEAHLFIQDVNQSPFNVGRRIGLDDFTVAQTGDLNRRYGEPLGRSPHVERLHSLVRGHPYLTRRGLDVVANGRYSPDEFFDKAVLETGPYGDHLKRLLMSVGTLPSVTHHVRAVLAGNGGPQPESDAVFRLLASGVLVRSESARLEFRCPLYESFLSSHLHELSLEKAPA